MHICPFLKSGKCNRVLVVTNQTALHVDQNLRLHTVVAVVLETPDFVFKNSGLAIDCFFGFI